MLVSIGAEIPSSCTVACIEHIFPSNPADGTITGEAEDITDDEPIPDPNFNPYTDTRRTHKYVTQAGSPFSVIPEYGNEVYDKGPAALVHSRTLMFLKYKIGGPWYDLEKVRTVDTSCSTFALLTAHCQIWDQHTWYEFVGRSVAKTMGVSQIKAYATTNTRANPHYYRPW